MLTQMGEGEQLCPVGRRDESRELKYVCIQGGEKELVGVFS